MNENVEEQPMVEYTTRGLWLEYADSLVSLKMIAEINGAWSQRREAGFNTYHVTREGNGSKYTDL